MGRGGVIAIFIVPSQSNDQCSCLVMAEPVFGIFVILHEGPDSEELFWSGYWIS